MSSPSLPTLGVLLACALAGTSGCHGDEPSSAKSSGGESKLTKAQRRVDAAHESFKREIQPAAGWVDEKSHRAADELGEAASKTADAVAGD